MAVVSERIGQFFVDGDRLEFTEYGGGDRVVVLVHGQLMPRRMHRPLARALAESGAHVFTLDLLGHGRSDRPDDPTAYSVTVFAREVLALLDHLEVDRAIVGGTSLGANVALETAVIAPDRVAGLIVEMPVLDNALNATMVAFTPMLFAARYFPLSIRLVGGAARRVRKFGAGFLPFWSVVALETLEQQPGPMAATLHGVFFGRVAPPARERRQIEIPALVVGHPHDPVHPAADAALLADELGDAEFVAANSILEWRFWPGRLDQLAADFVATTYDAITPARTSNRQKRARRIRST